MTKKGFIGLLAGLAVTAIAHVVVTTNERREKEENGRILIAGALVSYHGRERLKVEERSGQYAKMTDIMAANYYDFHTQQLLTLVDVMTDKSSWLPALDRLATFHWKVSSLAAIPGFHNGDTTMADLVRNTNTEIFAQYGVDLATL